jgi:hypothetical protein
MILSTKTSNPKFTMINFNKERRVLKSCYRYKRGSKNILKLLNFHYFEIDR